VLRRWLWLPAMAVLLMAPQSRAQLSGRILYLQPIGRLQSGDLETARGALAAMYGLEVRTLPPIGMPQDAWYAARKRYRAEILLKHLASLLPPEGCAILGVTAADISTTSDEAEDWGVLGLASLDNATCVVSSYRCRNCAPDLGRYRMAKVAVHETGHALGLEHCPDPSCLLADAKGSIHTIDGEYDVCPRCREDLARGGIILPANTAIPWPRPVLAVDRLHAAG
jgi:archaemetzincin